MLFKDRPSLALRANGFSQRGFEAVFKVSLIRYLNYLNYLSIYNGKGLGTRLHEKRFIQAEI